MEGNKNTIFDAGDLIIGLVDGREHCFRTCENGNRGAFAVYGSAVDCDTQEKVFLKKYIDPGPGAGWFHKYFMYQRTVLESLAASDICRQMVAGMRMMQDEDNRYYQIVEFVEQGQSLKHFLESNTTTWDRRLLIAKALMFTMMGLHEEAGIVHGDLKPDNLMLALRGETLVFKLIDFDRAILLEDDVPPWVLAGNGYTGTDGYFSPEHKAKQRPTDRSDIFTCGLILYELLGGGGPLLWNEKKKNFLALHENFSAIPGNPFPMPHFLGSFGSPEIDQQIGVLLHQMLEPNPANRPDARTVHEKFLQQLPMEIPKNMVFIPAQQPIKGRDPVVDIVFLVDATGSMTGFIRFWQQNIRHFVNLMFCGDEKKNIPAVENWRARVVGYRDFTDCNASAAAVYAYTRIGRGGWFLSNPFTNDPEALYNQFCALKAFGGGGEAASPESLLDALMLVLKSGNSQGLDASDKSVHWRTNGCGRVVIAFTDAGFHPVMCFNSQKTYFDERELYPGLNLEGCSFNDLQEVFEADNVKLFLFAPKLPEYEKSFGRMSKTEIKYVKESNNGLQELFNDQREIDKLHDYLLRGVSSTASETVHSADDADDMFFVERA